MKTITQIENEINKAEPLEFLAGLSFGSLGFYFAIWRQHDYIRTGCFDWSDMSVQRDDVPRVEIYENEDGSYYAKHSSGSINDLALDVLRCVNDTVAKLNA